MTARAPEDDEREKVTERSQLLLCQSLSTRLEIYVQTLLWIVTKHKDFVSTAYLSRFSSSLVAAYYRTLILLKVGQMETEASEDCVSISTRRTKYTPTGVVRARSLDYCPFGTPAHWLGCAK